MQIYLCDGCDTLATLSVEGDTIKVTKCKCQTENYQKEEQQMTQTLNYVNFPFTHKGWEFNSKIAETSAYLPQIKLIGDVFIDMNKGAIDELMPDLEDMSWASIEKQLVFLNEGATEMWLELKGVA